MKIRRNKDWLSENVGQRLEFTMTTDTVRTANLQYDYILDYYYFRINGKGFKIDALICKIETLCDS